MKYKVIEFKRAGTKTEVMPGLFSMQRDDSITVEIWMDKEPEGLYPCDVLATVIYKGIRYFFGSSTRITGKNRTYVATYWRNKPVW